jgi:dTDP-4-amino-4,6-dideoxygalactose transaminase
MNIPFVDLKAQYRSLKPEMDVAIQNVLDRTAFIMGAEMKAFEQAFAEYIGVKYALGVCSGTDALHLALRALGIGPGHEVITCADTYIATCEAITHAGAQVRLVDADAHTYNLDPEKLEAAITPRTRAVMPVHLYGQPADMEPIVEVARKHHLFVVEDCAQAHGSTYRGKKAGTFGDVAGFSFYPGKNLGAYGDGGAVLTNDDDLADRVRVLRDHGQKVKYEHLTVGYCSRLDNLQAAVLGVKLPHLDEWNAARRSHAQRYAELLAGAPNIVTPFHPPDVEPVYHLYVIRVTDGRRDALQTYLNTAGISTGLHYPIPVHLQKAYADLGHKKGDFPVCELIAEQGLSLPMFAELTDDQIVYVTDMIIKFMQN